MSRRDKEARRIYSNWSVSEARRKIKLRAVEYKGGKCEVCAYNKCAATLEFHHDDPSHKDFQLSSGNYKKWDRIKDELDKCRLLCANCHREVHHALDEQQRIEQENFVRSVVPARKPKIIPG